MQIVSLPRWCFARLFRVWVTQCLPVDDTQFSPSDRLGQWNGRQKLWFLARDYCEGRGKRFRRGQGGGGGQLFSADRNRGLLLLHLPSLSGAHCGPALRSSCGYRPPANRKKTRDRREADTSVWP